MNRAATAGTDDRIQKAMSAGGPGMANQGSALNVTSRYDNFLFAPICDEPGGMRLSVLSTLARTNVDPWEEAAWRNYPRLTLEELSFRHSISSRQTTEAGGNRVSWCPIDCASAKGRRSHGRQGGDSGDSPVAYFRVDARLSTRFCAQIVLLRVPPLRVRATLIA